jgi:hypothetical protein
MRAFDSRTISVTLPHLGLIRYCENSLLLLMLFLGYPLSLDDLHSLFPTVLYSELVAHWVRMIIDAPIEVWIPGQSKCEE